MDEKELKAAYAAFLFETPASPLEAAIKLFPEDNRRGYACWVALNWPNDPEVKQFINELKADDEADTILLDGGLTRKESLNILRDIAHSDRALTRDRIAAVKLNAELKNYKAVETPGGPNGKVMPKLPVYKIVTQ